MLISDGEAWISAGLFLLVSVNSVSSEGKISQLKLFGILIVPCLRPERDKCSISLVLSEERTHFWLEQPFLAGYHWFDTHPSNDWLRVISRGGVCTTRSNKVLASFYLHFGKLAECRKMRMNVAVWECVCVFQFGLGAGRGVESWLMGRDVSVNRRLVTLPDSLAVTGPKAAHKEASLRSVKIILMASHNWTSNVVWQASNPPTHLGSCTRVNGAQNPA